MGFKDFVSRLKDVPAFLFKPGGPRKLSEADLVRMEAEARRLFKDAILRIGNKQWPLAAEDIEAARKICTEMGWQDGIAHADYLLDQALAKKAGGRLHSAIIGAGKRGQAPARHVAPDPSERDHVERLRQIIRVSDRIEVAKLANALGIDEKVAWQKVFDWAEQFGFKVDGNTLVFKDGDSTEFIDELDKEYAKWHSDKI